MNHACVSSSRLIRDDACALRLCRHSVHLPGIEPERAYASLWNDAAGLQRVKGNKEQRGAVESRVFLGDRSVLFNETLTRLDASPAVSTSPPMH